jgi:hypothetical protein
MDSNMSDDIPNELAAAIVEDLIKGMIATGELDVIGLTNREVTLKGIKVLYQNGKKSSRFENLTITYAQSLSTKANELYLEKEYDLSIVTYATWWEHWINGVIHSKLSAKDVTEKEFKEVIKSLNIRSKCTWFLKLLDLPQLDSGHLKTMDELVERRNQFVHYKYPSRPIDDPEGTQQKIDNMFGSIKNAEEYFNDYEHKHIHKSFKPEFTKD